MQRLVLFLITFFCIASSTLIESHKGHCQRNCSHEAHSGGSHGNHRRGHRRQKHREYISKRELPGIVRRALERALWELAEDAPARPYRPRSARGPRQNRFVRAAIAASLAGNPEQDGQQVLDDEAQEPPFQGLDGNELEQACKVFLDQHRDLVVNDYKDLGSCPWCQEELEKADLFSSGLIKPFVCNCPTHVGCHLNSILHSYAADKKMSCPSCRNDELRY